MMCWLLRLDQQTMHTKRIIGRPSFSDKSVHRLGHGKKTKTLRSHAMHPFHSNPPLHSPHSTTPYPWLVVVVVMPAEWQTTAARWNNERNPNKAQKPHSLTHRVIFRQLSVSIETHLLRHPDVLRPSTSSDPSPPPNKG